MQNNTKIYTIQALRGIAVISVIIFHLMTIEIKYGGIKTIIPSIFHFTMFGVDLFFVISGFIMIMVTQGKFQQLHHTMSFIYHRVSKIYPTYWFYTLLILAVFVVKPSWVNSAQGNQMDILSSMLLYPSDTLPIVMVGWTLIHEMYFYVIFSFLLLFVPERKMPIALILWGMLILVLYSLFPNSNVLIQLISHPLTIEFIAGGLLAIIYNRKNVNIKSTYLLMLAFLSFILSLIGYLTYVEISNVVEPLHWWRIAIFGIPSVLITYLLINAERNGYTVNKYLVRIGNSSYSIYLSHILTLSAVGRVWQSFATEGIIDNIIMIPILLIFSILAGMLGYVMIEKPLHRLTRKSIQGRSY